MPTYYVDTDVSGGSHNGADWTNAYATLALCIAGISKTLTAPLIINCRGATADATLVDVDGFNSTSSNTITIQVPLEYRAKGKVDTGKYRIAASGASVTAALSINDPYVTVIGVQIGNTNAGGIFCAHSYINDSVFNSCIAYRPNVSNSGSCGFTSNGSDTGYVCINCLAVDQGDSAFVYGSDADRYYNCVALNTPAGFSSYPGSHECVAYNCYAQGTVGYNGAAGTFALTTCASSDGSVGSTAIALTTAGTAGTRYTNITAYSQDIHIAEATSALISAGTDLTSIFTTDIDGTTRRSGSAWDIGCHEYVGVAPAGHPAMARWNGIPGMNYTGRKGW